MSAVVTGGVRLGMMMARRKTAAVCGTTDFRPAAARRYTATLQGLAGELR